MIPGSANPLLLASTAGYKISRSVRLNSVDSAYFSRTPASAGNRKTWTWAGWVKRSDIATQQSIWSGGSSGTNRSNILFQGNNELRFFNLASSVNVDLVTTPVFRDPSAWYHIVLAADTTQATAADRIKIYVNGSQITAFSTSTYPSQNLDLVINSAVGHVIGRAEQASPAEYFSGYLTDVHFIDGQALTPSSFGKFDTNNIWQPKAYSGGTYGTNGFKLDFADNSAATATTLGKDTSGNSNNWTPNNLSVTAGAGNDSLVDSPTNYGTDTGAGGEVRGNYCTLNPLDKSSNVSLANGNLDWTGSVAGNVRGTIAATGSKFYFETAIPTLYVAGIGVASSSASLSANFASNPGTGVWGIRIDTISFMFYADGTNTFTVSGMTNAASDVYQIAIDATNPASISLWVGKNNTWYNSSGGTTGNPSAGTNPSSIITVGGPLFPIQGCTNSTNSAVCNFGQRQWAYAPPAGFKALCTQNLPTPTITKPSTAMDVKLFTGNGSTQTISGLGFSPDLVWIKSRSLSEDHNVQDTVRGAGNNRLRTNDIGPENTQSGQISSFNSDGWTMGNRFNTLNATYAAWCWDAGSSTVTNTAGSISSQVRANASAGFSIVTWTGNGATNATVGHGLNIAPLLYIVKRRDSTSNWTVFLTTLIAPSGGNPQRFLNLNNTDAVSNASQALPSSTVLTVQSVFDNINSATYVAYCFAPVAGYSAFGSYTGNGLTGTSGPFIYCGFRPRFVFIKKTSSVDSWKIFDSVRDTYNVSEKTLQPDKSDAELVEAYNKADILSNGFAIRVTNAAFGLNTNDTFIYAAFAESPFALARAR